MADENYFKKRRAMYNFRKMGGNIIEKDWLPKPKAAPTVFSAPAYVAPPPEKPIPLEGFGGDDGFDRTRFGSYVAGTNFTSTGRFDRSNLCRPITNGSVFSGSSSYSGSSSAGFGSSTFSGSNDMGPPTSFAGSSNSFSAPSNNGGFNNYNNNNDGSSSYGNYSGSYGNYSGNNGNYPGFSGKYPSNNGFNSFGRY